MADLTIARLQVQIMDDLTDQHWLRIRTALYEARSRSSCIRFCLVDDRHCHPDSCPNYQEG